MRRHLLTSPRLYLYTAGGMLLETAFMLAVCILALQWSQQWLVLFVAGMSLGILLVYVVVMDVPMAIRRGYPWGDVSGLWWLAKAPPLPRGTSRLSATSRFRWRARGSRPG
jgi:hypothetical protein